MLFAKTVNGQSYFRKKTQSQIFDKALNTPLLYMQVQNQHLRTSIDGFPADLLKSLNIFLPSKITARYVQKYRFKSKAKKTEISFKAFRAIPESTSSNLFYLHFCILKNFNRIFFFSGYLSELAHFAYRSKTLVILWACLVRRTQQPEMKLQF